MSALAILNGTGNTIGGTTAAARNVISKNYEGIEINTANNTIQGNYIGTDISGTLNRGNRSGDGDQIQGTANNTMIGGTAAGAGNPIAYNAGKGVAIHTGTGHQVLGNSIYSNTGLGIDLGQQQASPPTMAPRVPACRTMAWTMRSSPPLHWAAASLNVTGYVGSAASQSTFANRARRVLQSRRGQQRLRRRPDLPGLPDHRCQRQLQRHPAGHRLHHQRQADSHRDRQQ